MTTVNSMSADAEVIVYNYGALGGFTSPLNQLANIPTANSVTEKSLRASIISIQTSKAKGAPYGQFEVVLAPTENFLHSVVSGSWCAIFMKGSAPLTKKDTIGPARLSEDGTCPLKMLGLVMSVRQRLMTSSTGARKMVYVVSGYDFGYLLTSTLLINSFVYGGTKSPGETIAGQIYTKIGADKIKAKTPGENLELVIESAAALSGLAGVFKLAGGDVEAAPKNVALLPQMVSNYFGTFPRSPFITSLKFVHGIDKRKGTDKDVGDVKGKMLGKKIFIPLELVSSPTIWDLMTQYSNPVLNELFCDLMVSDGLVRPVLMHRQIPYNTNGYPTVYKIPNKNYVPSLNSLASNFPHTKLFNLCKTKVDSSRLIDLDMGSSEHERITYVSVLPQLLSSGAVNGGMTEAILQNIPINDVTAVERLGQRPMIRHNIDYAALFTDVKECLSWAPLMSDWWFNSHRYLNGTFTFTGLDQHIALGENFEISDLEILGQVEAYSHSFTVDADRGVNVFRTTVSLVKIASSAEPDAFLTGAAGDIASVKKLGPDKQTEYGRSVTFHGRKS